MNNSAEKMLSHKVAASMSHLIGYIENNNSKANLNV